MLTWRLMGFGSLSGHAADGTLIYPAPGYPVVDLMGMFGSVALVQQILPEITQMDCQWCLAVFFESVDDSSGSLLRLHLQLRRQLHGGGLIASVPDEYRTALFLTGRQHARENLATVMKERTSEFDKPFQMCDALSRNMPEELKTIVAN